MTSARLLIAAALILATTGAARAEPAAKGEKAAKAHFQRGEDAFNLGKFEEALSAYEAAYAAKPLPGLLFNIGQCHRHLGNNERALFFYRRYLALEPETPNRSVVERFIAELERGKATAPPPAGAPSSPLPSLVTPSEPAVAPPPARAALPAAEPSPPAAVAAAPPAAVVPDDPPAFVSARPAPAAQAAPLYRRGWFWATATGVVVAGVVTALVLSSSHGTAAAPAGNLSTIDWR